MDEKTYRTEVVPYAFPENNREVCEIGIEKMSVTYVQEDDTNHGGRDDVQTITIETEDAIVNREEALNKQSYYFTIKTDRWAISDADELSFLLNDFKDRLYHNVEQLKAKKGNNADKNQKS